MKKTRLLEFTVSVKKKKKISFKEALFCNYIFVVLWSYYESMIIRAKRYAYKTIWTIGNKLIIFISQSRVIFVFFFG